MDRASGFLLSILSPVWRAKLCGDVGGELRWQLDLEGEAASAPGFQEAAGAGKRGGSEDGWRGRGACCAGANGGPVSGGGGAVRRGGRRVEPPPDGGELREHPHVELRERAGAGGEGEPGACAEGV